MVENYSYKEESIRSFAVSNAIKLNNLFNPSNTDDTVKIIARIIVLRCGVRSFRPSVMCNCNEEDQTLTVDNFLSNQIMVKC